MSAPSHEENLSPLAHADRSTWFSRLCEHTAFWMLLILLGLVFVFSLISPNHAFFSVSNFFTIALNASQLVLLAAGMTFLLGSREFDLSVGANVVLSSILSAKTITGLAGTPDQVAMGDYPNLTVAIIAGVAVALLTGTLFGLINGLVVTRLKISSFLVTLATTTVGLGIALVITHGANVPDIPRVLQISFATNKIFGVIPLPVAVSLIIVCVLWYVLSKTRFGTHTLALGSSPNAARRAGIDINTHSLYLFSLMGLLCGVAAVLDISRFATTNIGGHQTDNLQAVAAAVIGGTSLFGGIASMSGTVIGTLIPVVLSTGLVIMGLDSFYQLIVVGLIVIVAVYIDQRNRQRSV
ncbi:ABC transporter permease [Sodalis sp. dw_96]|uniref:ABC transporter permease n=1 Tax=Sodalis sp. dw_96 TaxID=2719794 RepID=UPI001BD5091F|nr:ABC transporter permease [Sodalis sp. dw_96]